jgi:tetratricopeptide (TPR) repeat protein/transcriptional regulator with XRE-family HTH domain
MVALRALREAAGLSQEALAERSTLSVRTIRNLELGRVRPRPRTLDLIGNGLALSANERRRLVEALPQRPPIERSDQLAESTMSIVLPPWTAPHQLPPVAAPFTGRGAELARLVALVDALGDATNAVPLAVVTGMPGVGKTALAVRFAHRVADRFPDGQLFVDLHGFATGQRPLTASETLARFLRALGVEPAAVPADAAERVAMYRTLMANRRVLLLLDNAASADQISELVPGGAGTFVVVTSRACLEGLFVRHGARQVAVEALRPAESLALLGQLVGSERVDAERTWARSLVEACGHLPLAVRIAAASLATRPHRSIAEAVGVLVRGDRLDGLALAGTGDLSIRAAFDSSCDCLDAVTRRVFALLGLVPGPDFTLPAVAALTGTPAGRASVILDRLVANHLVDRDASGDRFRLHDLLRTYAVERAAHELGGDDRDAVHRLIDYYIAGADTAGRVLAPQLLRLPGPAADPPFALPDEAEALRWLEAERPNLVAAVRAASDRGEVQRACRLADALRALFTVRCYHDEWRQVVALGMRAATAGGYLAGKAAMQANLAAMHWSRSDYPAAREAFEAAVPLCRAASWAEGEATALGNLGGVYRNLGELDRSELYYRRALDAHRAVRSERGMASVRANLASLAIDRGNLGDAIKYATTALAHYRTIGSRLGTARQLQTLGLAYQELGRLRDAERCLAEAVGDHRAFGSRDGEADCLDKLARVARDAGQHDRAAALADEALAICQAIHDGGTESDVLNTQSSLHLSCGDARAALDAAAAARVTAARAGYRHGEIEALIRHADATAALNQPAGALSSAGRAYHLACDSGFRLLEGRALAAMAAAHLVAGRLPDAIDAGERALTSYRATGQRTDERRTVLLVSRAVAADR